MEDNAQRTDDEAIKEEHYLDWFHLQTDQTKRLVAVGCLDAGRMNVYLQRREKENGQ